MLNLNDVLQEARRKAEEERLAAHRERQLYYQDIYAERCRAKEVMFPHLRPACLRDYKEWLRGYLEEGGAITHCYDYPIPINDWWIAHSDFEVVPLYGADSVAIVVPGGITAASPQGDGHNRLYLMDGFRALGGFVPLYSDIEF